MKNVRTIFLKELREVLRDRRTVFAMVLAPVLIYPLLITVVTQVMRSEAEQAQELTLRVGISGDAGLNFNQIIAAAGPHRITENLTSDTAVYRDLVKQDSMDVVYFFPAGIEESVDSGSAEVMVFYESSNDRVSNRLSFINNALEEAYRSQRLLQLGIKRDQLNPVAVSRQDYSTDKEILGGAAGSMITYFFMIFCFLGCMYPAIDLGAGEKERGTMETLLTSPASRLEIFIGKFGVVSLAGITSAVLAIASLALTVKFNAESFSDMPEMGALIQSILSVDALLLLLAMLIPLTVLFASGLLTLSISAKSFKEAQSMISPMMVVIIMPAMLGMMPGFELNPSTALIPLLNVSLASKDVLAGTIETGPYMLTMISLLVLAAIGVVISLRFFRNERNVVN